MIPRRAALYHLAGAAAAIVFFLLSQSAAATKSAVYDEPVHLLSGYRILTAWDHDFNHEHPPLMKALAAAPIVVAGAARPLEPWTYRREYDEWPLSHDWLYHANDADRLLRMGRMPNSMIGALLAMAVFLVTWSLVGGTGAAAASVAAGLFALEPNLLAHGSLVTTDMGMTAFYFLTAASFWRYLETRGSGWLALSGILWGLGLSAKFTAVLLGPALLAMGVAHLWTGGAGPGGVAVRRAARAASGGERPRPSQTLPPRRSALATAARWWSRPVPWETARGRWPHLLISLAVITLVAIIVLNTSYGYGRTFASLSAMRLESEAFQERARGPLGSVPLPLPASFVQGYDHAEAGGQRWWSYLMGEHSMTGWRHYYLVALLVKTPIPLLILALAGLILWGRVEGVTGRRVLLFALPPLLMLAAFTVSGSLKNIGLRYVLPVYPFMCLFGGIGAAALWRSWRPWGRVAAAVLLVWVPVAEARIYPDQLAYFNEIAGGPEGGRWWLLDSNLDWGQDLKGLGRWMKENGVRTIFLDYFGRACPRYYGVETTRSFEGGWIAVSATNQAGVYRSDKHRYDFLEGVAPAAAIGHSILVYNVPRPPGWTPLTGGSPD